MAEKVEAPRDERGSPESERLSKLVAEAGASTEALMALLEHPELDELHLCLLLERKELPGHWLERVAANKSWTRSYRVRLRLARHPHAPKRIAAELLRQLHLFDLVQISLLPSVPGEIQRLAEELVLARLLQLPLGVKLTLARRSPARIAGALLREGHAQVVALALDNALLTESQILKVLAGSGLPERVVTAIGRHPRWSHRHTVRLALLRHPLTPLGAVLTFLPELTASDLREIASLPSVSESVRNYIRHEISRRSRGEKAGGAPRKKRRAG